MVDYSNGKIYMIITENSNDIYVGSTVQTLKQRLHVHASQYKSGVYCSSQEILKQGNYKIVLIKNYACNSKLELETEETKYQRDLVCVNKKKARITEEDKKQYRIDNRDKTNKRGREIYAMKKKGCYIGNKQKINVLRDEKFTCECGGKYTGRNKAQHEKTDKHKKHLDYMESKKQ